MRPVGVAPLGYFTLAEAARTVHTPLRRVNYWCAAWGAGLVKPAVDPGTSGGAKWLSLGNLVQLALIPRLFALGLSRETVAGIFGSAEAHWWDIPSPFSARVLEWMLVFWGRENMPHWVLLQGAYEADGRIGRVTWRSVEVLVRDLLWRYGPMQGMHCIELSGLKYELAQKVAQSRLFFSSLSLPSLGKTRTPQPFTGGVSHGSV